MKPKLLFGQVMHHRLLPKANYFRYPVFFIQVPVHELKQAQCALFSVDRWNVFSLRQRDYGPRDGGNLYRWVCALLAAENITEVDGDIVLQTFPRVLGYAFNPVSFWLCHDRAGGLRAVLTEVNNTFGERHMYLLHHSDHRVIAVRDDLQANKCFHVSPFLAVNGEYRFRFSIGHDKSVIRIDHSAQQSDVLHTSIVGQPVPLSSRQLASAFFRIPLMTFGVIARIHWQAIKLWAKGVPWFAKPAPPTEPISK